MTVTIANEAVGFMEWHPPKWLNEIKDPLRKKEILCACEEHITVLLRSIAEDIVAEEKEKIES